MEKPSSYSVAPGDRKRDGILTRGALVGVVLVALVGLVLVFPKDDLLSRLRGDQNLGDRELTITYLRNLIRTEQADAGLRLLLVEKLIEAREFAEAEKVLGDAKALVGSDSKLRDQWSDLDLALAWAKFRAAREKVNRQAPAASAPVAFLDGSGQHRRLPEGLQIQRVSTVAQNAPSITNPITNPTANPAQRERDVQALEQARSTLEAKLRAQVPSLNSSARAFALLAQSQDIGASQLSRSILQRLKSIPGTTLADLLRAGNQALSLGLFDESAALYFTAKARTADTEARRNAVVLGVKALLSGGKPALAYQAALRELDAAPAGDASHWQLVDWALGAGQPAEAVKHLRQVVPSAWDAPTLAKKLEPLQLAKALEVSLAGADLPEALKLAQAGLLQNPQQTALRARYAQIAEWSGKPQEALSTWLALMQQGAGDKDLAIANVMRLSPMLFDDDALLAAWLATQNRRSLSLEEITRVLEIYERLGQPQQGLDFLQRAAASATGSNAIGVRALQAQLLERAGRSAQAIAALEALRASQGDAGLPRAEALRLANLYIRAGDIAKALDALRSFTPATNAAFDAEYWDLRADLAFETAQMGDALAALEKILGASTTDLQLKDYQVLRMVRVTQDQDAAGNTQRAQALARSLYPRIKPGEERDAARNSLALLWLDMITLVPRADDLNVWLATLSPAHLARALADPAVLTRRANIYASLGNKTAAAKDYRASLALRSDTATRASYWWLLIDAQDATALRAELAAAGAAARSDTALQEVQGAAWQVLGEPRRALAFYAKQTKQQPKSDDYLWLTNYADVLEQSGEAALALRVRRHAFGLLTAAIARFDSLGKKQAAQTLLARVRLSESFSSGDEKTRLAKLLGQAASGAALDADLRRQADDLIVSWALGTDNGSGPNGARTELAQRWLWQQQARKVGSQDYAELALALARGDVQALDRLMERSAKSFQPVDQLAAVRALVPSQPQRLAQAATLGVELAQRAPESPKDDAQQEALEADLRQSASRVRITSVGKQLQTLRVQGVLAQADVAITPRLRFVTQLQQLRHSTQDTSVLAAVPRSDRELAVGFRLRTDGLGGGTSNGELTGQLTQRQALATVTGLVLQFTQQLTPRLNLQASTAINQRSDDSAALSVAGMQDKLAVSLSYTLAKDIALNLETSHSRYRTQGGSVLGASKQLGANATYTLRRDYPDWTAKVGWRRNATRADGQADAASAILLPSNTIPNASFFVAPSSTSMDISIGWGLSQSLSPSLGNAGAASRAWRPFGELGLERSASGGNNQTSGLLRLGARGSVAGRDQLAIGLELRPSPAGLAGGKTSRELRVQYEWTGDK